MTVTQTVEKQLVISKEIGQRWKIEFTGKVTQRDMNQLKRLLPVEFARMQRRKRIQKLQRERMPSTLKAEEPVLSVKQTTNSQKESTDGPVRRDAD
jgi:hypothetical protein